MALTTKVAKENGDIFVDSHKKDGIIIFNNENSSLRLGVKNKETHKTKSSIALNQNETIFHQKMRSLEGLMGEVKIPSFVKNILNYDLFTPSSTLWYDATYFFMIYNDSSDANRIGDYDGTVDGITLDIVKIEKFPCVKWFPRYETGCKDDYLINKFLNEPIENRFVFTNESDDKKTYPQVYKDTEGYDCIKFDSKSYFSLLEKKPNPTNVWMHFALSIKEFSHQTILSSFDTNDELQYSIELEVLNEECQVLFVIFGKKMSSTTFHKNDILNKKLIISIQTRKTNESYDIDMLINGNFEANMRISFENFTSKKIVLGSKFTGLMYDVVFDSYKKDLSILAFLLVKYRLKKINQIYDLVQDNGLNQKALLIKPVESGQLIPINENNNIIPMQSLIQMYQTVSVSLPGGPGMFQNENAWDAIMNAITYLHRYNGGTVFLFPGDYFIDRPLSFIHKETYDMQYLSGGRYIDGVSLRTTHAKFLHSGIKPYWINVNNVILKGNDKKTTRIISNNKHHIRQCFMIFTSENITIEKISITGDYPDANNQDFYELVPNRRYTYKDGWMSGLKVKSNLPKTYNGIDLSKNNSLITSFGVMSIRASKRITLNDLELDGKCYAYTEVDALSSPEELQRQKIGHSSAIGLGANLKYPCEDVTINRCVFKNFQHDCVSVKSGSIRVKIVDCHVVNSVSGFDLTGDRVVLENCIVDCNGRQWSGGFSRTMITVGKMALGNDNNNLDPAGLTGRVVNCKAMNGCNAFETFNVHVHDCHAYNCIYGFGTNYNTLNNCIAKKCLIGSLGPGGENCQFEDCDVALSRYKIGDNDTFTNNQKQLQWKSGSVKQFAYWKNLLIKNCKYILAQFPGFIKDGQDRNDTINDFQKYDLTTIYDKTYDIMHRIQFQDFEAIHEKNVLFQLPIKNYSNKDEIIKAFLETLNEHEYVKDMIYFEIKDQSLSFHSKYNQLMCMIKLNHTDLLDILHVDISNKREGIYQMDTKYPISTPEQSFSITSENNKISIDIHISTKVSGVHQPILFQSLVDLLKQISLMNMKNNQLIPIIKPTYYVGDLYIQKNMSNSKIFVNENIDSVILPGNLTFFENGFFITIINISSKHIEIILNNKVFCNLHVNTEISLCYINDGFHIFNSLNYRNLSLHSNIDPQIEKELGIQLQNDTTLVFKVKGQDGITRSTKLSLQ